MDPGFFQRKKFFSFAKKTGAQRNSSSKKARKLFPVRARSGYSSYNFNFRGQYVIIIQYVSHQFISCMKLATEPYCHTYEKQ